MTLANKWTLVCGLAVLVAGWTASPAWSAGHPSKTDVFAGTEGFTHTSREGVRYDDRAGGFRLQDDPAGGFRSSGSFTLEGLRYGIDFNQVVASWNADCPSGTWLTVELSASADSGQTWSAWYEMAAWGDASLVAARSGAGSVIKKDGGGRVNEDTLELAQPASRLRCRVTLHTERRDFSPLVTLVGLAVVDKRTKVDADDTPGPAWGREVGCEFRSQGAETSDMSYRLCGPTSTTMALSAHGLVLPTRQVARACWDDLNGIYGNWPFIAAGASALMRQYADTLPTRVGAHKLFAAYVAWPSDWKGVESEVALGRPCVVSIRFGKGELKGAKTVASDGHLILVKGFTRTGDVICYDPAARDRAKGRVVYDRQELHAARHGGPVILFQPYGANANSTSPSRR